LKLGVFGGTFDPPHVGHLILAAEVQAKLGLDRILWVLTPEPPHKRGQTITPLAQRLAMLQSAIQDNPDFELSRVDIDRPPPHYSLDTLRCLRLERPQDELIFVMGGDSLGDLPTWHEPDAFLAACDALAVVHRPYEQIDLKTLEEKLPGIRQKLRFVQAPLLEISATQIRQRVACRDPFRYFLPAAVYQYIRDHHLYQDQRAC
jgi:nicotinate-nucleotide adenylyltransferase